MRKHWYAVAALALVAACGSGDSSEPEASASASPSEAGKSVEVYVVATNALNLIGRELDGAADETDCTDMPGAYSKIREGSQVEIVDSSGATVGVGDLGAPIVAPNTEDTCVWRAIVPNVQEGAGFYQATFLDWQSKKVPEADLESTQVVINANAS